MSLQPEIKKQAVNQADFMGRELKIKSEQFPGIMLNSKVVGIYEDCLLIDRSGSGGLINELINNQKITVFVNYKGEPVSFESSIISPMKGRMYIPISEKLLPEVNRAFERYNLPLDIRMAYFNNTGISTARLNRLKWMETQTLNISGGGVMVKLPADLTDDYYTIIHLGLETDRIPKLLLGQVRHSTPVENRYHIGIEFIIKETYKEALPRTLIRNLPEKIFEFNDRGRQELDHFIKSEEKERVIR